MYCDRHSRSHSFTRNLNMASQIMLREASGAKSVINTDSGKLSYTAFCSLGSCHATLLVKMQSPRMEAYPNTAPPTKYKSVLRSGAMNGGMLRDCLSVPHRASAARVRDCGPLRGTRLKQGNEPNPLLTQNSFLAAPSPVFEGYFGNFGTGRKSGVGLRVYSPRVFCC